MRGVSGVHSGGDTVASSMDLLTFAAPTEISSCCVSGILSVSVLGGVGGGAGGSFVPVFRKPVHLIVGEGRVKGVVCFVLRGADERS